MNDSDKVDAGAFAQEWVESLAMGLNRSVDARQSGVVKASQVIDLHFHRFMADEIGCVKQIYELSGRTLSADAEGRMRRYLVANPADKHGHHRYRFADTGLDLATERKRTERYRAFFQVPTEEE